MGRTMIQIRQNLPDSAPGSPVRFPPGSLIRHRRYGYRGVVVAFDLECRADEGWYRKNRTQPARDQPWYHVLVHGSMQTTYAAQTSLMPDPSGEPIAHPLLGQYFGALREGYYERNDRDWPVG